MHIEMASFQALNALLFLLFKKNKKISKSDNNFRKSVMICQIIDSVDNHFGEYLWHFLVVRLYSWHNSKEPADCKLIHETVQHAELSQPEMRSGGIRLLNLNRFTET